MVDFATAADVAAAWRPLTAEEIVVVDSRVEFISAIIRAQVPGIDAAIAAGTLAAELVKHVAVAAVLRNMRNPEGKSEEQIEDYRYKRDASLASGSLYLTAEELALLSPRRRGHVFSITLGQEPADYGTLERVATLQEQWRHWPTLERDGTGVDDGR